MKISLYDALAQFGRMLRVRDIEVVDQARRASQ